METPECMSSPSASGLDSLYFEEKKYPAKTNLKEVKFIWIQEVSTPSHYLKAQGKPEAG